MSICQPPYCKGGHLGFFSEPYFAGKVLSYDSHVRVVLKSWICHLTYCNNNHLGFLLYTSWQALYFISFDCKNDSNIISRPDDFFAEMAKSDEHMQKVRKNLMAKQAAQARTEKVRQLREQKKIAKKVQVMDFFLPPVTICGKLRKNISLCILDCNLTLCQIYPDVLGCYFYLLYYQWFSPFWANLSCLFLCSLN